MVALYNENDPAAAAVLRQLISDGVIAPGDVDTRSIKEVQPDDLRGYTQVHLFAGGGLWSVAARLAGWPDDRPLWTGSCPCQPFSAAGKGLGADDPRHLWPDFFRLIGGARAAGFGPAVVVGEQVSGKAGYHWFDGVRADLAQEGFASRTRDFPASAVDAPHQRNRLYWVAVRAVGQADGYSSVRRQNDDVRRGRDAAQAEGWRQGPTQSGERDAASGSSVGQGREWNAAPSGADLRRTGVTQGDAFGPRLEGLAGHGDGGRRPQQDRPVATADGAGATGIGERAGVAQGHASESGQQGLTHPERFSGNQAGRPDAQRADRRDGGYAGVALGDTSGGSRPGFGRPETHNGQERGGEHRGSDAGVGLANAYEPVIQGEPSARQLAFDEQDARARGRNGTYWSDAEWLLCHDGKARRAQSGIRLLVDGLPGRVDLWRVGGNAIVPQAAAEVIAALKEALDCRGIA